MIPEILFIGTVSAAILLILFDIYIELVAAATVVLAVFLAVDAVGPSPYMALMFLVVAMTIRAAATVIGSILNMDTDWDFLSTANELLTDDTADGEVITLGDDD